MTPCRHCARPFAAAGMTMHERACAEREARRAMRDGLAPRYGAFQADGRWFHHTRRGVQAYATVEALLEAVGKP